MLLILLNGALPDCSPRDDNSCSHTLLTLSSHSTSAEEHRKNCERQGKYVEAEIAKNRLEELRLHEENRRKEAMRSRQIAERLGVEEAHMLEFQQFNIVWDKKMAEYERHSEELKEVGQAQSRLTNTVQV